MPAPLLQHRSTPSLTRARFLVMPGGEDVLGRADEDDKEAPCHLVFSRSPPRASPELSHSVNNHTGSYTQTQRALSRLWTVICTTGAQQLWLSRNDASFNNQARPHKATVRSVWRAIENQVQALLTRGHYQSSIDLLPDFDKFWLSLNRPVTPHPRDPKWVRLYFDGGSRGNPGISGSGCVILERDPANPDWTLMWWASVYVGHRQTNNYAEHRALAEGVRECCDRYQEEHINLTIIGDSQLILSQVAGAARVTQDTLRGLVNRTSTGLNAFPRVRFCHTLRAGNTMADYLANIAMDNEYSTRATATGSTTESRLQERLPHDTTFPTFPITRSTTSNLLTIVDALIERHETRLTQVRRR